MTNYDLANAVSLINLSRLENGNAAVPDIVDSALAAALGACEPNDDWAYAAEVVLTWLGDLDRSAEGVQLARRLLTFRENSGDNLGRANTCLLLGTAQRNAGALGDSLESFRGAERLFRELAGDSQATAHSIGMQGLVLHSQRELHDALEALDRAGELLQGQDALDLIATFESERVHVLMELEQYEQACQAADHCASVLRELGDHSAAARCLIDRGFSQRSLDLHVEAQASFEEARKVFLGLGDRYWAARCQVNIGMDFRAWGEEAGSEILLNMSVDTLDQVRRWFVKNKYLKDAARCELSAAYAYIGMAEFSSAFDRVGKANTAFEALNDSQGMKECQELGDALLTRIRSSV